MYVLCEAKFFRSVGSATRQELRPAQRALDLVCHLQPVYKLSRKEELQKAPNHCLQAAAGHSTPVVCWRWMETNQSRNRQTTTHHRVLQSGILYIKIFNLHRHFQNQLIKKKPSSSVVLRVGGYLWGRSGLCCGRLWFIAGSPFTVLSSSQYLEFQLMFFCHDLQKRDRKVDKSFATKLLR